MAGAKQLVKRGFILVPAGGGQRPAGVCRGTILHCTMVLACRRGLQARWERRLGLQVPVVLIEASANIMVKAESVQVIAICRPLRLGDCPSFYRPRRLQFTSMPHYFVYV
jgi:hypothetical protein